MTEDPLLKIDVLHHKGTPVVRLCGELDMSNVHRLREAFESLGAANEAPIVDASELAFIDSAGLNAIATFARKTIESNAPFYLIVTRPTIRKLFSITRLDEYLTIVGSLEEVVA